jgi:hypothetical protein
MLSEIDRIKKIIEKIWHIKQIHQTINQKM